jgi:hypothetical protein
MSAFLVNDGTIDRVVCAYAAHFERPTPWSVHDMSATGRALIAMNIEALRQRYGDPPLPFTYDYHPHTDDNPNLALLRALHCFIYQCSEGNVPDSDLYQQVEAVVEGLQLYACKVYSCTPDQLYNRPEYNALPWDFDDR